MYLDRPIFVGGTGRSGTTIAKRIFASHSEILALAGESRFLVDPDGLLDLLDALTDRWIPPSGDRALPRFERLMRHLEKPAFLVRALRQLRVYRFLRSRATWQPYPLYDLGVQLGLRHYRTTVAAFMGQLELHRFRGVWPGSTCCRIRPVVRQAKSFDRSALCEECNQFVARLLGPALERVGASRWLDDTPMCFLQAPRLCEVFPDMRLIHIFRDPRDVIASMMRRVWGPGDVDQCTALIRTNLETWLRRRSRLSHEHFRELKFEDLIAAPESTLRKLCAFLEIELEPAMLDVDLSRANIGRYQHDLTDRDIGLINGQLEFWMEEKGYAR